MIAARDDWLCAAPERETGFKFDLQLYNQDASHERWPQSGVQSTHFEEMLLARQERRIRHSYEIIDDYIEQRR